jgi:acetyltransferase-like isoleucine patch superfamily enzyme
MAELTSLSPRGRLLRRLLRPVMRQVASAPGRLERLDNDDLIRAGILVVGRHVYGRPRVLVWTGRDAKTPVGSRVRIGNYVSIAGDVEIFTGGEHRTEWVTTYPLRIMFGLPGAGEDGHPATRGEVTIGNDVWLGHGARIMSGASIGDGAVVGAGALVVGTVRPYAVVAGVPAREIRRRFSDDEITALLSIRWWDWPESKVIEEVDGLCGAGVSDFVAKHGRSRDGLGPET